MNPVTGLDNYLQPLNMESIGKPKKEQPKEIRKETKKTSKRRRRKSEKEKGGNKKRRKWML